MLLNILKNNSPITEVRTSAAAQMSFKRVTHSSVSNELSAALSSVIRLEDKEWLQHQCVAQP